MRRPWRCLSYKTLTIGLLSAAFIVTLCNILWSQGIILKNQGLLEEQEYALSNLHDRIALFLDTGDTSVSEDFETSAASVLQAVRSAGAIIPLPSVAASQNVKITGDIDQDSSATETESATGRRKLVLHIGPMKTGSTTLQSFAAKDHRILALQDDWFYPRNWHKLVYTQSFTQPCSQANESDPVDKEEMMFFRQTENATEGRTLCEFFNTTRWNEFESFLKREPTTRTNRVQRLPTEARNMFLIDEMYGVLRDTPKRWELMERAFASFDVKIVMSYRRYFEWFVSYYTQAHGQYGPIIEEEIRNDWPSKDITEKRKRYNNRIRPINEYHELLKIDETSMLVKRWNIKHDGSKHPLEAQYHRFKPHFSNIQIFNFHVEPKIFNMANPRTKVVEQKPTNLVAEFYDQVLGATNTAMHRRRVGLPAIENAGDDKLLPYDMIAVAAYDEGWIDTTHAHNKRRAVAQAVKNRWVDDLKKSFTDLPLICLNETQQNELREWSLAMERRIVPEWAATHEQDHNETFQKYMQKKKFCSVDAQQFIRMYNNTATDNWRRWFQHLKLPPPPPPAPSSMPLRRPGRIPKGQRTPQQTQLLKGRNPPKKTGRRIKVGPKGQSPLLRTHRNQQNFIP